MEDVTCIKKHIKDEFGMKTKARDQFCITEVHISNGSTEMITISTTDITGLIGRASYQAHSATSDLGGEKLLSNINPDFDLDARFAIGIPTNTELEYVQRRSTWSFHDAVAVKAR